MDWAAPPYGSTDTYDKRDLCLDPLWALLCGHLEVGLFNIVQMLWNYPVLEVRDTSFPLLVPARAGRPFRPLWGHLDPLWLYVLNT